MDAEAHADCPGHGASVASWRGAQPNFYCLDPVKYGHVFIETGTTSPPEPVVVAASKSRDAKPNSDRKIVVEGNKAWVAAAPSAMTSGDLLSGWCFFAKTIIPDRRSSSKISARSTRQNANRKSAPRSRIRQTHATTDLAENLSAHPIGRTAIRDPKYPQAPTVTGLALPVAQRNVTAANDKRS
jgi:hypothetical protein